MSPPSSHQIMLSSWDFFFFPFFFFFRQAVVSESSSTCCACFQAYFSFVLSPQSWPSVQGMVPRYKVWPFGISTEQQICTMILLPAGWGGTPTPMCTAQPRTLLLLFAPQLWFSFQHSDVSFFTCTQPSCQPRT